jgi:hypothetical protein
VQSEPATNGDVAFRVNVTASPGCISPPDPVTTNVTTCPATDVTVQFGGGVIAFAPVKVNPSGTVMIIREMVFALPLSRLFVRTNV